MNFYVKVLLAVALLVGAALAAILLLADSEEEKIEGVLEGAAEAAGRGDAEGVIAIVSKRYAAQGQGYEDICARIRREISPDRPIRFEVGGATIQVNGDRAEAQVVVTASAGLRRLDEFSLKIRLRKEENAWQVTTSEEIR